MLSLLACRHNRFDGRRRAIADLRGQADGAEHVHARPLADAGKLDAACGGDGVCLHGAAVEERPDELPRALPRHPLQRLVAVLAEDDGFRRRRWAWCRCEGDGQEEGHAQDARDQLPERHCRRDQAGRAGYVLGAIVLGVWGDLSMAFGFISMYRR